MSDLPEAKTGGHTVAVFANRLSDADKGWEKLVAEAGRLCGRNDWQVLVLAQGGDICRPLLSAARDSGAEVVVLADESLEPSSLPKGVLLEVVPDEAARLAHVSDLADGYLVMPTSLAAIRDLHRCWALSGGGSGGRPVAMLNRNRAFEVFRGYAQDILNQSISNSERVLMFADALDELVPRLQRALDAQTGW